MKLLIFLVLRHGLHPSAGRENEESNQQYHQQKNQKQNGQGHRRIPPARRIARSRQSQGRNLARRGRVSLVMMTRRTALWLMAGAPLTAAPALAAAPREFWNEKEPSQWSPQEIEQMLNDSPWARRASISLHNSAPGFGAPGLGGISRSGRISGATTRGGTTTAPDTDTGKVAFEAVIRWESARPIRAAEKIGVVEDPDAYVLTAVGDFPNSASANDDPAEREQQQAMLREYTKLDRKGDGPIYLERTEPTSMGLRFYFSRLEPITAANKEITFSTKMGPLELKAKFPLKDMTYRGKLEL
jgi:hypothetical protein